MPDILVRSAAGLANLHRFHDGKYIIYCESEPDRPESLSGDVGFWTKVLSHFRPANDFIIKPQGGNATLCIIAERLSETLSHRSICVVDRDFSDLHQCMVELGFVIYTYGYSYENDLLDVEIIVDAIDASLPGITNLVEVRNLVIGKRLELERHLRRACLLDQMASFYFQSLFERKDQKFKSLFDTRRAYDTPSLSLGRLKNRVKQLKTTRIKGRALARPRVDDDLWRRLYGHLSWWIHARIVRDVMHEHGFGGRLDDAIVLGLCLRFLEVKLHDDDWPIGIYYEPRIRSAFDAAA